MAIMPDGERQEIDPGSSVRLQLGAQVNFGVTHGEIVDPKAPAPVRRQPGRSADSPPGNFVVRHWRGGLSLPVSFLINAVPFRLVWPPVPSSLLFFPRTTPLPPRTLRNLALALLE